MIRIAFRYGDPRIFARLVCLLQGGDSAHCEVSVRQVADVHECISASFLDGGVRLKTMPLPPEKWRIYELPGDPIAALAWFDAHDGSPYDLLGLAGFVWRRIKGLRDAWFCSEAAADMIGLRDPWRYDLALLESVCHKLGRRVQ
jgi:hypothetical protein